MTLPEACATEERRLRRDQYRQAGGSHRRPLRSFLTGAEKRERREQHAERVRDALAHVETAEGFCAFLAARELNPDLTPLSQALAALQAPGHVVGTVSQWRRSGFRVKRGEHAGVFLTAPGFWPAAAFAANQTDAPAELANPEAPRIAPAPMRRFMLEALRALYRADGRKTKTLNAFAETLAEDDPEAGAGEDEQDGTAAPQSDASIESGDDCPF